VNNNNNNNNNNNVSRILFLRRGCCPHVGAVCDKFIGRKCCTVVMFVILDLQITGLFDV
jgi:hypothetical protein